MKRIILYILALWLLAQQGYSQSVEFKATTTQVVAEGERFQLSFTVNKQGRNFKQPDLSSFSVLSGPNTSSSTSMQIINGQVTQNSSFTYSYILQAVKAGNYTINPAEITVDGQVYKSNQVKVEVIKGTPPSTQNQNNQNNQNQTEVNNDDLFVSVQLSKTQVYQGEYLVATLKIFTRIDIEGFDDIKFPNFSGFWTQDIENPTNISLQRENINGQIYNSGLIKKVLLIPQRSGSLSIDPFQMDCIVRVPTNRRDWLGRTITQRAMKSAKSQIKKVNVLALPANKPAGFSGAVGAFTMIAKLDRNQVKTNDALTLRITISGNGNLKLVEPIAATFPTDFDAYDPKIVDNITNSANGSGGTKTFEYIIFPRHAGNYTIAPIEFSYFDLATKTFKTITSSAFDVAVEKGEEGTSTTTISTTQKESVKVFGQDIRYIKKENLTLHQRGKLFFGTPLFYLLYVFALLIFGLFFVFQRKRIQLNANATLAKNRKARTVSRKRLKTAQSYLTANDRSNFYTELLKALWGYLSDKLSIPLAELNRDKTLAILQQRGIEKETIDKLMNTLDTCEFARYSPSSEVSQMEHIFTDANELIGLLENKLR